MSFQYVLAIADQNYASASMLLDSAIRAAEASSEGRPEEKQAIAQLYMNRGYCQQKLQTYRRALKVCHHRGGTPMFRPVCGVPAPGD